MRFDLFRTPRREPPSPDYVLHLWACGFDTLDIARRCGVKEAVIFNMIAKARDADKARLRGELVDAEAAIARLRIAVGPPALFYPCLHLPPLAAKLLAMLHEASPQAVSRVDIAARLFGEEMLPAAQAEKIDALVQYLRRTLRIYNVLVLQRGDAWSISDESRERLDVFAAAGDL